MGNMRTVQEMYAVFGRGDVPSILSRLGESVEREYDPCRRLSPGCSGGGGETTAASFFARLAAIELHRFTPKEFLEGDDTVVVLLDVEFTVRATAKRCSEEDEIHVWRFDSGEVTGESRPMGQQP